MSVLKASAPAWVEGESFQHTPKGRAFRAIGSPVKGKKHSGTEDSISAVPNRNSE
jgi:hypothetical protein